MFSVSLRHIGCFKKRLVLTFLYGPLLILASPVTLYLSPFISIAVSIILTFFYTFLHSYNSKYYWTNDAMSGPFDLSVQNLYHSFNRSTDKRKVRPEHANLPRGDWPAKRYSMRCCRKNCFISLICATLIGLLSLPIILLIIYVLVECYLIVAVIA